MKYLFLGFLLVLVGCAHKSPCGNLPEAKAVFYPNSCKVRIKQVVIGTDLKIPQSIKNDLSLFEMNWKDPESKNGKIETGQFIILTDEVK